MYIATQQLENRNSNLTNKLSVIFFREPTMEPTESRMEDLESEIESVNSIDAFADTHIEDLASEVQSKIFLDKQACWNEEVVEAYKLFLLSGGKDFLDLPKGKRSNFRRRASDFAVREGNL